MSGMYNVVFGQNPMAEPLLAALGFTKTTDVGRFRDAWVEMHEGDPRIVVYTRNGGGNRECYGDTHDSDGDCGEEGCPACSINVRLPQHALYAGDVDDDFDCTYARVFFRVPAELVDPLRAAALPEERDPDKMWMDQLAKLDQGEAVDVQDRLETALRPLLDHLKRDAP